MSDPTPPTGVVAAERVLEARRAFLEEQRRRRRVRAALSPHGLLETELGLLAVAALRGEDTVGRLSAVLELDSGGATRAADGLAEHGLVTRHRTSDDRRVVLMRVTDKGRATLAAAEPDYLAALAPPSPGA